MITQLDSSTVRLITSGQVAIDIPSILKELIENSIDASATSITVTLDNNGLNAIVVKDNGHGIPKEDRESMALRYHTSKLRSFEDLRGVRTMGFRGEALASCAQAGQLTITTRTKKDPVATICEIDKQGKIKSEKPIAADTGTQILLQNLFTHLPVRRQTMQKRASSTPASVKKLLTTYALAYPTIRFGLQLRNKGKRGTGGDWVVSASRSVEEVVGKVLGKGVVKDCVWLEEEDAASGVRIQALLPKREANRSVVGGKGHFLYIDSRPVSSTRGDSKTIIALVKSYFNIGAATAADPFVWMNIICPPGYYDPNLEPAKDRVMFGDSAEVIGIVEKVLVGVYGERPEQEKVVKQTNTPAVRTTGVISGGRGAFGLLMNSNGINALEREEEQEQVVEEEEEYVLEIGGGVKEDLSSPVGVPASAETVAGERLPELPLAEADVTSTVAMGVQIWVGAANAQEMRQPMQRKESVVWKFSMYDADEISDNDEPPRKTAPVPGVAPPDTNVLIDEAEEDVGPVVPQNPWTLAKMNSRVPLPRTDEPATPAAASERRPFTEVQNVAIPYGQPTPPQSEICPARVQPVEKGTSSLDAWMGGRPTAKQPTSRPTRGVPVMQDGDEDEFLPPQPPRPLCRAVVDDEAYENELPRNQQQKRRRMAQNDDDVGVMEAFVRPRDVGPSSSPHENRRRTATAALSSQVPVEVAELDVPIPAVRVDRPQGRLSFPAFEPPRPIDRPPPVFNKEDSPVEEPSSAFAAPPVVAIQRTQTSSLPLESTVSKDMVHDLHVTLPTDIQSVCAEYNTSGVHEYIIEDDEVSRPTQAKTTTFSDNWEVVGKINKTIALLRGRGEDGAVGGTWVSRMQEGVNWEEFCLGVVRLAVSAGSIEVGIEATDGNGGRLPVMRVW
ncbi:hypothetical protein SAICODRAFT_72487 [Saitoella complicata NRRL Y-17804]|uniref:DNA mismatch repair protein S5 domain-containing protein n=1 Tax=Saitoella complicata (strain BCRC 22490 / CBS 7301 / JCM 7358 / NBRC 10748 / NRRL Y-17804) TaxID=698492 RepID=A0A0E9NBU4_SAICN|nr:uncharacterized protein SAICODRAFT_72487 [Saitoella complicata NRRL Y-17804]ODQ51529.1 hypothetical protein SAICODRAFT_72487 [Saitoella complicata NRRL Y-17804]GAO47278.1 hypothetical protein G7K_1488-t1 [Saitoella complicata NRRL Y-17804]